ncbi:MAG: GNAT family N-acetyltransferase [Anaerolineales bacterium]|nr:GNAT family N-acetyltransferase [Anaerolineales bacterium]
MPDTINVRPASVKDAPGIARVHVLSWQSAYAGIVDVDHLANLSIEQRTQRWQAWLSDVEAQFVCVAEIEGGEIVGFAAGTYNREPLDAAYAGELWAIYILPQAQRQGVGRRLVQGVVQALRAQGLTTLIIWALAENPGRHFYEALGGEYIRTKDCTIGEQTLPEVAYGWLNTDALVCL